MNKRSLTSETEYAVNGIVKQTTMQFTLEGINFQAFSSIAIVQLKGYADEPVTMYSARKVDLKCFQSSTDVDRISCPL